MIVDIHTHIFPETMRNNREKFFVGEPAFKLLYNSPKAKMVSADALIETMDADGVDKSIIFGFPWINETYYKQNNDCVIEAVNKYPDRLIGMACFDVSNRNAVKETERCLEAGLKGVGELAFYQSGIDKKSLKELEPIMEICRNKSLPVNIHTNEPVGHMYPGKTPVTLAQIYDLGKAFPDNKIILAHLGGGIFFYNLLKKEGKETLKNFWYDTAAVPFLYDLSIYNKASLLAGADRILYGSDYPLLKPSRYFNDMEKGEVNKELLDKIKGENARALFDL